MSLHVPHGGAIEVHHEPLGRVERDRVDPLDALQPYPVLGTDEGAPGVGGVHVEPQELVGADLGDLVEGVEGASTCRPQGGADLRKESKSPPADKSDVVINCVLGDL
jgi:hypothetical protein